jgi:hypothetical protein
VAAERRRLEVGEVADDRERLVERRAGERRPGVRLRGHDLVPGGLAVEAREHVVGVPLERRHECGVELSAGATARDRERRARTVGAPAGLDEVRELDEAHRERDLVPSQARGALAVPAGEEVAHRLAHRRPQTEPLGDHHGGLAVRRHRLVGAAVPLADEGGGEARALPGGSADADVPQHEAEEREAGEVDVVGGATEGDVVAEPPGELVGVRRAADPGEEGDVVRRLSLAGGRIDPVAEPDGDQTGAQHMLGRLAHAEVDPERQGRDELGEADPRVVPVPHRPSLRPRERWCGAPRLAGPRSE